MNRGTVFDKAKPIWDQQKEDTMANKVETARQLMEQRYAEYNNMDTYMGSAEYEEAWEAYQKAAKEYTVLKDAFTY